MISAAIALFAVSAFAQTGSTSNEHGTTVSSTSKETDDLNKDGKLSREEKEARKTARKAEAEYFGSNCTTIPVSTVPPFRFQLYH